MPKDIIKCQGFIVVYRDTCSDIIAEVTCSVHQDTLYCLNLMQPIQEYNVSIYKLSSKTACKQ